MPVRDPEYYFSDGNIVILVEDTLFKLHKTRLLLSPTFATMFSISGSSSDEDTSDDAPLPLPGDTVVAFRSFVWALYAPFHEVDAFCVDGAPSAVVERWQDVLRVAHKYELEKLQRSAERILAYQLRVCKKDIFYSGYMISSLLDGAARVGDCALDHASHVLLEALERRMVDVSALLMACDRIHVPRLLVSVCRHLFSLDSDSLAGSGLSDTQREQLQRISTTLAAQWDALAAEALPLTHSPVCVEAGRAHRTCADNWQRLWYSVVKKSPRVKLIPPADVAGRMDHARVEMLDRHRTACVQLKDGLRQEERRVWNESSDDYVMMPVPPKERLAANMPHDLCFSRMMDRMAEVSQELHARMVVECTAATS